MNVQKIIADFKAGFSISTLECERRQQRQPPDIEDIIRAYMVGYDAGVSASAARPCPHEEGEEL